MAGVTDVAFQALLDKLECPLMWTEMISAQSLLQKPALITHLLLPQQRKSPIIAQIFGTDPEKLSDAAHVLIDNGADGLDINMGCPAKKIVRSGCGIALMQNPRLAERLMKKIRKCTDKCVGVKLRLGWSPSQKNIIEFIRMAEDTGLDFITVHARYRSNYSQPADWKALAEVVEASRLPIIGNGDVVNGDTALGVFHSTHCNAVMIGRAILGNPWLPAQIEAFLEKQTPITEIPLNEKFDVMLTHLDLLTDLYGARRSALIFRKHAAWYCRGLPYIAEYKKQIFSFTEPAQYIQFVQLFTHLQSSLKTL
ncbi:tRNA-dihydrouridine synthase [bacterium]|nr:tRNA-dihydrouridine synthase [candidate division CSSED10-310 bacterium]